MAKDKTRSSLQLLYTISRELASSLDLRVVLSQVLFLSIRNAGAERGSLIVLDEELNPVDAAIVVHDRLIPHTAPQLRAILEQGLAGWVVRQNQPVLASDTSKDERWMRRPDDDAQRSGAKSAVCIPLMMGGGQMVGVMTIVHSTPGYFREDHLKLLQAIADQAGIAIFNARLVASLQGSNQRYRELFEDSITPILVTDWKGRIFESNRQAVLMTGFEPLELSLTTIFDLHTVDGSWLAENTPRLHNEEILHYESEITTRLGASIPIEVFVRKVNIEGGDYLQWMLRDISERRELDLMRQQLMDMVYHDLRAPLSNIVSGLGMLETSENIQADPLSGQVVHISLRAAERMQRMISSLLDISRMRSSRQTVIRPDLVEIPALVAEGAEVVRPVAENKQQTLHVESMENLPRALVDADMIKRVIINLLENSARYTPAGGNIWIGGAPEKSMLSVWVEDDGPGIPDEAKRRIFESFFRLSHESASRGLGLGLAFCNLAVEAHGGKIWVEDRPGGGARFVFTLPKKDDEH